MTEWLAQLERFSVLAADPSDEEGRQALLWQITKEFFESPDSFDREEASFFGEVMEELAYGLEKQVREELARRIAAEERAPHRLVLRLAHDEIPVSRPVLRHSPVLTEDDLVEISGTRSQDHLLAISQRMEVGVRLSAVLAARGNDNVVHHLARNPNAKLSPDTIDLVASRSKRSRHIQAALIDRQDVPREILLDLLDHVSEKVRRDIHDKVDKIDENYLDEAIASMKSKIQAGEKCRARQRIDELEQRHALNEYAILGFLGNDEPIEFLLGLARLCDIDVKTARRVIDDSSGQALAVACRANNISAEGFKKIASSAITAVPSDPMSVLPLVKLYNRVTEDNAKSAMRFIGKHLSSAERTAQAAVH